MTKFFGSDALTTLIPHSATTVESIIISDSAMIEELRVHVSLVHENMAELYLQLISPNGEEYGLVNLSPFNGPGELDGVVFDDRVTKNFLYSEYNDDTNSYYFSGEYRTLDDFDALRGGNLSGTWKLVVKNPYTGGEGTIREFRLEVVTK